jgi:hypothetical protein
VSERYEDLGGQPVDAPQRARGCGQPPHLCNHPDNHTCPWLNEDHQGHAIPCGCTHEPPKGRK